MTVDQAQPQALEIERAVLASMLLNGKHIADDVGLFSPDDFYNSANQQLFATLKAMASKGLPVDMILLSNELERTGLLESIGGRAYLTHLMDDVADSTNLKYHAEILREKSNRRKMLSGTHEIQNLISHEAPLEEITQKFDLIKTSISGNENKIVWDAEESQALVTQMLITEPEPFAFIVPGLLPKGVCGFIYGEGGSYKSLAALWLCIQRAAGHVANSKWLDRFEIHSAGKSMFCSIEDQIADIHNRMWAVVNRFSAKRSEIPRTSIDNAIAENFHIFPRERWMQDGFEHIVDHDGNPTLKADTVARYASDNGIDLIILDTLSRLSLVDENDNNAGARLVSALERIRDASGASVITIAHSGKAGRTGKTDTHGQNGLRGASALMDNGRFGLWFRPTQTKGGQPRIEIINAKTFRAKRAEPFKVSVDYPAFTLLQEEETGEDDLMPLVVEDIKTHPATTQRGTRERLRKKSTHIKQAFKDADEEGLITYKGKGKGYFINE